MSKTPEIRLPPRVLCLVTALAPGDNPAGLLESVQAAVRGGVNMVQVRAPGLERTAFFNLAASVMEAVGEETLVIVNNRVDVALAIDAGGVQLDERGPAERAARRVGGPEWLIGRTVTSVEAALKAQQDGADFLLLGDVSRIPSHPGQADGGTGLTRRVVAEVSLPVIAFGEIDAQHGAEILSTGACGVAVCVTILGSAEPEKAAAALRAAIEGAQA